MQMIDYQVTMLDTEADMVYILLKYGWVHI